MKLNLLILCLLSFSLASDLKNWIVEKSNIINANQYIVKFTYSISKSKNRVGDEIKNVSYYSINTDSSLLKLDNKILLTGKEAMTIVSMDSKQVFYDYKDQDLEEFKNKVLSIFLDGNYKLIKVSNSDYILSLNDYFLNLDISYYQKAIGKPKINVSFFQNPYMVHVEDLVVTSYDSIPYSNDIWNGYEVFNLVD